MGIDFMAYKRAKKNILDTILKMLVGGMLLGMHLPGNVKAESLMPPKSKQTILQKYVTATQAYDMWRNDPGSVAIIDVRSLAEYVFVGHASMAVNIPIISYQWDPSQGVMVSVEHKKFEQQVTDKFKKDQILLVMCRSGSRAAKAVNRLAELGFTDVYNITDGFEGDKVKDKRSVFKGKRVRNGWKNALLDWTYELNPALVYKD